MSAIVFTLHQRPFYTRSVLEAWTRVRGVEDWPMRFYIDPSVQLAAQIKVLAEFQDRLPITGMVMNAEKKGVLLNPYFALDSAFGEGHDFVVLAEEDVLPAYDALEYFNFAKTQPEFLAACAWSDEHGPAEEAVPRKWFNPWLWGASADMWAKHIRSTWDLDYSTGDARGPGGWDCNLGLRVVNDRNLEVLFPKASRSQHIGQWLGVHQDPNQFGEQEQPAAFVQDRKAVEWRLSTA